MRLGMGAFAKALKRALAEVKPLSLFSALRKGSRLNLACTC
jgi:hypothetical protein